jgi:hypothetical protein
MSTNIQGSPSEPLRHGAPYGQWQRSAPWVAPLLTVGVLALATFVMFANCGVALI